MCVYTYMSLSSFFENLNNDGTCSGGEEVSYMRETKIHHVCTTFGCKGGRGRGVESAVLVVESVYQTHTMYVPLACKQRF
mmetsp:Transcript_24209/g.35197  ORF Transcript_24209/g.35197 Transcript_24209/m.35197 type:complete len:80 (+) Transcript_24209:852-1091(+)